MKVLSIHQPWAWLIVRQVENLDDKKDVENRNRRTNVRGEILIHASKTFDWNGLAWISTSWRQIYFDIRRQFELDFINGIDNNTQNQFGGIIGKANLVDCVENYPSKFFFGKYGYILKDAVEVPFMPCLGKPGFFDIDYKV